MKGHIQGRPEARAKSPLVECIWMGLLFEDAFTCLLTLGGAAEVGTEDLSPKCQPSIWDPGEWPSKGPCHLVLPGRRGKIPSPFYLRFPRFGFWRGGDPGVWPSKKPRPLWALSQEAAGPSLQLSGLQTCDSRDHTSRNDKVNGKTRMEQMCMTLF